MASMAPDEIAARVELRSLVDEYAWRTDQRDYEGFADLFTSNGELLSTNPGQEEPFFRAAGREALVGVVHGNDQFTRTFHAVQNHRCYIDGETAMGVTYCTAHHLLGQGSETEALVMLIRYHDNYAHAPEGWLFTRRRLELLWVEYVDSDTSDYPFRKGSADWMKRE